MPIDMLWKDNGMSKAMTLSWPELNHEIHNGNWQHGRLEVFRMPCLHTEWSLRVVDTQPRLGPLTDVPQ